MQNLDHVATEDSLFLLIVKPSLLPSLHEKSNKKGGKYKKKKDYKTLKSVLIALSNKAASKWLPRQVNLPEGILPSASSYGCTLKVPETGKSMTRGPFHTHVHTQTCTQMQNIIQMSGARINHSTTVGSALWIPV